MMVILLQRHIDQLLNFCTTIENKEPSVNDKFPLGPSFTREISPIVDSVMSSNSNIEANLSTPETDSVER